MQKYSRLISLNHKLGLLYWSASHPHQWRASRVTLFASSVPPCMQIVFASIILCWVMKFFLFFLFLSCFSLQSNGLVVLNKESMSSFSWCFRKWSFFLLFAEMKAGQKPGVSYERCGKRSVVCQDTVIVLGHWLCPHVIYYPSQWAHSCLAWPFHRAPQSLCVHSTSPSPVPALPHPVCVLIST